MKSEFDTEMDRLLRGHARHGGTRAGEGATDDPLRDALAGGRAAGQSAHLDADELSAFAEQALPDAARVRCAAHLADCDDCRRLATQLALGAGGVAAREERAQVAPQIAGASWRERLAAMFAPRAWRFAMPLVALLCVGVVALVLMKSVPRPGASEIARLKTESESGGANVATQDEHHATTVAEQQVATATNAAATPAPDAASRSVAEPSARSVPSESDDQKKAQASGAVASAGASNAAAEPPRVESQPAPAAPASSVAPVLMATPIPVPMPTPAPDVEEIKVAKDASKDKPAEEAERAETRQARSAGERGSAAGGAALEQQRAQNRQTLRSQETVTVVPGAKTESNTASRRARQRSENARDDEEKSDAALAKPEGQTRSAGGHKFRREGDAWIDTAYSSGQATVNVRRNSEQYRALIADEPQIGRISDALGGEVVVVWKGRAYRIKP